jgi:hypothetical protein
MKRNGNERCVTGHRAIGRKALVLLDCRLKNCPFQGLFENQRGLPFHQIEAARSGTKFAARLIGQGMGHNQTVNAQQSLQLLAMNSKMSNVHPENFQLMSFVSVESEY